jgi:LmbE family N-acetylglucosaminyl deacetylase
LSDPLLLDSRDRLLILAPHPDDESIATGGLIQFARNAGAAIRVVVLTDGDNNPWPQRWVEKRWRIGPAERARWGARRREEARAAMRILGLAENETCFLGLPDLGLTDLLMRADAQVIESLHTQFGEFAPTVLVLPALGDRHPDHSATSILARLALARYPSRTPRVFEFAVHGNALTGTTVVAAATAAQRTVKQAAILAHASQMRLSRRRFLRYATLPETYRPATPLPDLQHPLRASIGSDGSLWVYLDQARWKANLRGHILFVVLESGAGVILRYRLALENLGDSADGPIAAMALPAASDLCSGYVKLVRLQPGWRVFDRYGWQQIEIPERNSGRA